jgi:uncharacterized protein YidB (DUF937 family)
MYRPATTRTPEVDFTLRDGRTMKLEGVTRVNDDRFYQDIIHGTEAEPGLKSILGDWIGDRLILHVRLTQISTPSQRGLFALFNVIKDAGNADVHWHWIDDDLESQRVGHMLNEFFNSSNGQSFFSIDY